MKQKKNVFIDNKKKCGTFLQKKKNKKKTQQQKTYKNNKNPLA